MAKVPTQIPLASLQQGTSKYIFLLKHNVKLGTRTSNYIPNVELGELVDVGERVLGRLSLQCRWLFAQSQDFIVLVKWQRLWAKGV